MKNKYSIFSLIKNAFSYHENWKKAWGDPKPKKKYGAVIVGGGGHGLASAFYLAKKHNMTLKFTLPGPMTICDSIADTYYKNYPGQLYLPV